MDNIGSKEWNDSCERHEWAFMVKIMREAQEHLSFNLSGLGVAITIAEGRAKSGWRDVEDKSDE